MIQRVGVRAGQSFWDEATMRAHSTSKNYYFLQFADERSVAALKEDPCFTLETLPSKLHTAGMPSVTKADIVYAVHTRLETALLHTVSFA